MKTFVIGIGLDDKTARYVESISAHFETIVPVDARESPRWNNRGLRDGPEIGAGAAGCLLAHEKIWGTVTSTGEPEDEMFLVIEDDSFLTAYGEKWFSSVLQRISRGRFDLVHVGRTKPGAPNGIGCGPRREVKKLAESFSLLLPPLFVQGFAWRTHAYLVSKRFARHLLGRELDFSMPVDQHLREIAAFSRATGNFRAVTSFQGLFLQTGRESLVEKSGR